ncbi:MAG: hypothetical protein FWH04_05825 [Oscillospiraceae bacterium]|nr:hypothetical protein [Oscillospiraceae bacterium]
MKIRGIICIIIAVFLLTGIALAHTMKNMATPPLDSSDNPGWVFKDAVDTNFTHAKSRKYDFKYDNAGAKSVYGPSFRAGIAKWDIYVSLTEKERSRNAVGYQQIRYPNILATATTPRKKGKQHIERWTIRVNINSDFASKTPNEKALIMAHEIGHIYGLGHLDYDKGGRLMTTYAGYNPSSYELMGMLVVTESHKHDKRSTDRYPVKTAKEHTRICLCKLYSFEKHKFDKFSTYPASSSKRSTLHSVKCICGQAGKDKKHSYGGLFGIGVKVQHTRATASEHNEIKKCKGCNYEQSVRKKHRFDKKGKCKDCGFVK